MTSASLPFLQPLKPGCLSSVKSTARPLSKGKPAVSSSLKIPPHLWPLHSQGPVSCIWDTSYCRQLEHTNVDHRGAQKTFPVMEEWGISLEHLSDANKFYTMRKCQDISPKPPRDHSCTLTGPEFPNPPPNSDLSPSHEVIKQEKQLALLNSWSHLEPDTLPSLWSL